MVKETYYENLEQVLKAFPNTELIRVSEAVKWLGDVTARAFYEDKTTRCKKMGGKWYISRTALARWLA